MKKETVIATNGTAYYQTGEKTVKKVFNSMKELSELAVHMKKSIRQSFEAYVQYLRTELPGEPIKVEKNTFTIKGFRFIFTQDGIDVKDILNYGTPVVFEEPPTPRQVKDFLIPQKGDRKFSPAEMKHAVEEGKRLLEERKTVPVAEVAKVKSTESLEQAKQKALRLISRIRRKEADSKRLIEEVPGMISFKPLNIAIGRAIQLYRDKKMTWGKFVTRVEDLIRGETFEKRKEPAARFGGFDTMTYKKVVSKDAVTVIVDDREREKGEFLVRYLLQRDKEPQFYVSLTYWVDGEYTDEDLINEVAAKDQFVDFDITKFRGLTAHQVSVLEELFYDLNIYLPYEQVYDPTLRKGKPIRVFFNQKKPYYEDGVIASTDKGIWIKSKAQKEYPLMREQKYKLL